MKNNKALNILKRIFLTILFPLLMFVVMFILSAAMGSTSFNSSWHMWRTILVGTSSTAIAALAIWLQVKNGRFDFSGGSVMVLSAIVAGNFANRGGYNGWVYLIVCVGIAMLLCLFTSLVYIFGRLPINICTIGVALLFESITYMVYDGEGINMLSVERLTMWGKMPYILILLVVCVAVFIVYNYLTVAGKRSKVLANNQQAAVNVGVKENANVILTFLVCGFLLGVAACILASRENVPPQAGLATAGTLFSNIIPAYMGMFVGMASVDAVGVVMAALAMEILNYGLGAIGYSNGGWQQIIIGTFMLLFYAFTAQLPRIKAARAKKARIASAE